MVQFCCKVLGISGDFPHLTDRQRENDQFTQLLAQLTSLRSQLTSVTSQVRALQKRSDRELKAAYKQKGKNRKIVALFF